MPGKGAAARLGLVLIVLAIVWQGAMAVSGDAYCFLPLLLKPPLPLPTPTLVPTCTATPVPTATVTPSPTATTTPTRSVPFDVRIALWCSQFDAPGNDNEVLNEEYVCFQNYDAGTADLTGWHVWDDSGSSRNRYTFGGFELLPGAHVKLHTGDGKDTATDLYWGRGQAIWNNNGDTVYLYDSEWNLIDSFAF